MGTRQSQHADPASLLAYVPMLAGSDPGDRFFEIRAIARDRPIERNFVSAVQLERAASRTIRAARDRDLYVGVALRTTKRSGGRQAIDASHLAYIECDTPDGRRDHAGMGPT
jgi:hypothetical protein